MGEMRIPEGYMQPLEVLAFGQAYQKNFDAVVGHWVEPIAASIKPAQKQQVLRSSQN